MRHPVLLALCLASTALAACQRNSEAEVKRASCNTAKADVAQAEAKFRATRVEQGRVALYAPFDGTVANRTSMMVEGTVTIDSPSLRNALRWAGQPPPGTESR